MNPDREIVNWWLNKRGFFTINNIKASKNREIDILAVKTKDGAVGIKRLQLEGGKPMSAHQFVLGHKIKVGDIFGRR